MNKAVKEQYDQLVNCHDFTTEVRVKLLEKLASIMPGGLDTFHIFSGGTECVEAALRLSKFYAGKHEFIGFHKNFHGKSLGSYSLMNMPEQAGPRTPGFYRAPFAYCYRCPFGLEYPSCGVACADFLGFVLEEQTTHDVAGVILEPIPGQTSIVPPDEWLPKVRKFCNDNGLLLVADEILNGFGRTGKMFAVEHWDTAPDILLMGKGLGSGYPVTAMASRREVFEKGSGVDASTSYGGNPVACAAALASIEVIEKEKLVENSARIGAFVIKRLKEMQESHPSIGDVRGRGLHIALEFVKNRKTKEPAISVGEKVFYNCCTKGVILAGGGKGKDLIRIAPPLMITQDLAERGLEIVENSISEVEKEEMIRV